jgi:quercetin dioxygenase-like cupin family protein
MDIRRFGPGHRRPDGPAGTQGVSGQTIHNDDRAVVSELAFQRYAAITPHSNPNTTLFIVISGGGYVQVGSERTRINHGEAVVWPPEVPHGAYTDGSEMRAIVVELRDAGDGPLLEGAAAEIEAAGGDAATGSGAAASEAGPGAAGAQRPRPVTRAEGTLAERQQLRDEYDSSEGEPW